MSCVHIIHTYYVRFFRCVSKAREARLKKIQAYRAKKFAAKTLDYDPEYDSRHMEQAAAKRDPAPVVVAEDAMTATSPVHSSEDDDEEEGEGEEKPTTDNDETDKQADQTAPPLSPLSVLSEQSSPELIEPPRKLEKNPDGEEPATTTMSTVNCPQSTGLLCGCI
jgi:hypothetical protein